jgi:hypothetical protein
MIMEILSVRKSLISLGFLIMTNQVIFIIISKSVVLQLGRQKEHQKSSGASGGGQRGLQQRQVATAS